MSALFRQLKSFFVSLQLTVALLILSLILVFVATLDQVNLGIWAVQAKYFRSFAVLWHVPDTNYSLPVFPGGYLIGGQAAGTGPMAAPAGEARFAAAPGNALTWTAPAHWQAKAASSFRKGSYNVPGEGGALADLAITAFPGDTGGLFANVNRWRGQIGLPPVAEAGLEAAIQRLDVNGFKIILVDATGSSNGQPMSLLGAMVPYDGQTWFFKLTGPSAIVAKEQAAFRDFLATIKAATP